MKTLRSTKTVSGLVNLLKAKSDTGEIQQRGEYRAG